MKKKIIIIVIIAIVVIMSLLMIVSNISKKNNNKEEKLPVVNTEKEVIKDQEFDGLKMTNTSLIYENGVSKLETIVENNSGNDYNLIEFSIIVKDKNDEVITTIPGYVGETIKNGEKKKINSSIDMDLSKAKKIEYNVKK